MEQAWRISSVAFRHFSRLDRIWKQTKESSLTNTLKSQKSSLGLNGKNMIQEKIAAGKPTPSKPDFRRHFRISSRCAASETMQRQFHQLLTDQRIKVFDEQRGRVCGSNARGKNAGIIQLSHQTPRRRWSIDPE